MSYDAETGKIKLVYQNERFGLRDMVCSGIDIDTLISKIKDKTERVSVTVYDTTTGTVFYYYASPGGVVVSIRGPICSRHDGQESR